MRFSRLAAICGGVMAVSASTELNANPYHGIVVKNAFALRPIPIEKPLPPPEIPPAPAMEIKLTGITTLLGTPCAMLEFIDPRTKKTDRPPILREGQQYNDQITIVAIDAKNGAVKIRNGGVETILDFERNGIPEGSTGGASKAQVAVVPSPTPNFNSRLVMNPPEIGKSSFVPGNPPSPMTREEALAKLQQQRELYERQNNPASKILPPAK